MEWISIKDRLPKIHETVNIKLVNGTECTAFKSKWFNVFIKDDEEHSQVFAIDVTHWKPIEITNK